MLEVYELQKVLQLIEQNGNPGISLLRLKADTGLFGSRLSHFVQKHPEIFHLKENGQMVEINKEAEHLGSHETILKNYETNKSQKKRMIMLIVVTVAFILIAGNGIGYLVSQRMEASSNAAETFDEAEP